jgi:hypothetical protein
MISAKNIFKKENLIAAGGLAGGSLAAEIVAAQLTKSFTGDDGVTKNEKIIPYVPVATGLLLATSTGVTKSVGHGMIAQGLGKLVKSLIPVDTQITLGIGSDVMLGNVMMGEPTAVAGYSASNAYDFTSATSGEANY